MSAAGGELLSLIESGWRGAPVLVVGDVMLDRYLWGEVERISPEAPIPVVRAGTESEQPGGAANVAMNLAALGARVTLASVAGADAENRRLEDLLVEGGIEPLLLHQPGASTTTKLRILAGRQQVLRVDHDAQMSLPEAILGQLLQVSLEVPPDVACLVLSDYAKGVLPETVCRTLIEHAQHRRIPVVVDPKAHRFERYRGATVICPNRKELAVACGQAGDDLQGLLLAGQRMLHSLPVEFMAVTLGERGIAVLREDSQTLVPAVARQVYDVSGAGDTVAAVLALALAAQVEIEAAARLANVAAGLVVGKVGTVPICRQELLAAVRQDVSFVSSEKVLPLGRLLARVASWRTAGERVVFTNGCFDLLHAGHISLLEQARQKGGRLVVGLNSDDSIRRLKGSGRPVASQHDRVRILAALSAVDAVTLFEEDTPLRLIEAIRPDVLVKGGDYNQRDIVGACEVMSWGGAVEILPLVPGLSTSALIRKSSETVTAKPPAFAISAEDQAMRNAG